MKDLLLTLADGGCRSKADASQAQHDNWAHFCNYLEYAAIAETIRSTTKYLIETRPKDWLALAGLPTQVEVEVIDADLATVTAEADRVLRVQEAAPWLAHLELQASYDRDLPDRILRYNVLLHGRHTVPVQSIAILLRPAADGRAMTGVVEHRLSQRPPYLHFEYQVVRIWQMPVGDVLAGGLGVLPLAPISKVGEEHLPDVIRVMEGRIHQEASPPYAGTLWSAAYILMGLRYRRQLAAQLLQGVRAMKESVTYQAIVDEGRAEEAREILLSVGQRRLGVPDSSIRAILDSIESVERLDTLAKRILDVESWTELLAAE